MGKLNLDPTELHNNNKDNHFPQEFPRILDKPEFNINFVRSKIPAECWERNTWISIYYFCKDYTQIIVTFLAFNQYIFPLTSTSWLLSLIAWIAYSLIQGTFMWSLFVIGHDCGHTSFSANKTISHFFGHLCHIPLLIPYHSWRISHALHHANQANVHKDEAYAPLSEKDYKEMCIKWPLIKFFRYEGYLLGGWTLYLIFGMPNRYQGHFSLKSEIYRGRKDSEIRQVKMSLFFFWAWLFSLVAVIPYLFGALSVLTYYLGAYIVCGAWISLVTYLHHTHPDAPWYRNEEWDYQRGALTTIDRDYGFMESIHHNVGTHTIHHFFTRIPHYNLVKANKAIRPILGDYYKFSKMSVWKTVVMIYHKCRFVADEGDVVFYEGGH